MRTVVENRENMHEPHKFDDRGFVYGDESVSEPRSCFYDFGSDYPVAFIGDSAESMSGFAESLEADFCQ